MNRFVSPDILNDFLNGVSTRVNPGDDWGTGVVITGDTAAAGTAFHEGEKMDRSEYERRLQKHREAHKPPSGIAPDTVRLNVVDRQSEPFPGLVRRKGGKTE